MGNISLVKKPYFSRQTLKEQEQYLGQTLIGSRSSTPPDCKGWVEDSWEKLHTELQKHLLILGLEQGEGIS